jgi:hypothetical protein
MTKSSWPRQPGRHHGERYIIDGGFLELVRMGVMSPNDWTIPETIPEYDAILKQTIQPKGTLGSATTTTGTENTMMAAALTAAAGADYGLSLRRSAVCMKLPGLAAVPSASHT